MSGEEGKEWIVPGKNRRLVKPRGVDRRVKFGRKRQRTFLEHLAATCNVTASAAAAGVSFSAVYRCRMRDPEFRAAWKEALEQGYALLEAALLERAMRLGARIPVSGDLQVDGPDAPQEVDWDKGLELLKNHQRRIAGTTETGRAPTRVSIEEVAAKLIGKMKALGVRPSDRSGTSIGGGSPE
jgi:hypothetical protein